MRMNDQKQKEARQQIKSVTNLGIVTNAILFISKLLVGLWAGSMALVADGVHSLSDMTTDFIVLLGVHFGSKEPDQTHPYGHGRIETLAATGISGVLIVVGLGTVYKAGSGIGQSHFQRPGIVALLVAFISIAVKELLYRITKKVAVTTHSSVLYANAWHHRTDAISSVAVVIGLVASMFGFEYGDRIAAMAVGIMITWVGIQIIMDCLNEFTEGAVDSQTIEHIKTIISENSSIRQWHKLRTRMVGREVFLDLHILVDSTLDIAAAHEIAENLENTLHEQIARPVNITVHIEPDMPELRK